MVRLLLIFLLLPFLGAAQFGQQQLLTKKSSGGTPPPAGTAVVFEERGQVRDASSSGTITLPTNGLQAGHLLVFHCIVRGSNFTMSVSDEGWTQFGGPEGTETGGVRQYLYYKISDGTETTVTYSPGSSTAAVATTYRFSGNATSGTVIQNITTLLGNSSTVTHNALTVAANDLGVAAVMIADNPTNLGVFSGAIGGTWVLPAPGISSGSSSDQAMMLQTVAGTGAAVSGGTYSNNVGPDEFHTITFTIRSISN